MPMCLLRLKCYNAAIILVYKYTNALSNTHVERIPIMMVAECEHKC